MSATRAGGGAWARACALLTHPTARWPLWGVVAWCTALAVLAFANTITHNFSYDDRAAVAYNQDVRPETPWSELFQHDFWGGPLGQECVGAAAAAPACCRVTQSPPPPLDRSSMILDVCVTRWLLRAVRNSGSHKSYRPITVATFRFNFWIAGLNPMLCVTHRCVGATLPRCRGCKRPQPRVL